MITRQQKKLIIAVCSGLIMFIIMVYIIHLNEISLGDQLDGKQRQCESGILYTYDSGIRTEVTDIMGSSVHCFRQGTNK